MPSYRGIDGAELHFDVFGQDHGSPPLILLHGGAARHPEYLGDLAGLSARHRLIVPHLRGVGRSAGARPRSWWEQAADIDLLRDTLGLSHCVLVGHSAGTRLANGYAAQFPGSLSGLVLITPPTSYLVDVAPDTATLIAARIAEPAFAAAVAASNAGPDTSSEETFNAWQTSLAPLCYARWDADTRAHAAPGRYSMAAARAFMDAVPPPDLVARLGRVRAPVLVLAATEDAIVGVAPVLAVAGLFQNGRAAVVEHAGHLPWVDQPAAFRVVLEKFLAELR